MAVQTPPTRHRPRADRVVPRRREPAQAVPAPGAISQFDRDYWIANCHGFRVDAGAGRIGVVEDVRTSEGDEPVLVVRAGLLGRRVLLIPGSEVAFVVPRAERIWLRSPVGVVGTEPA